MVKNQYVFQETCFFQTSCLQALLVPISLFSLMSLVEGIGKGTAVIGWLMQ